MDIKWYKSQNNSDGPNNGGYISDKESGEYNFKDIDNKGKQEVEHCKLFVKLVNVKVRGIRHSRIFMKNPRFSDDFVTLSYGNKIDTQKDLHHDREQYGIGTLVNDLKKDDFRIKVRINNDKDMCFSIFRSRDLIYISSKNKIEEDYGQFVRIDKNHPVRWDGNLAIIQTETPISKDFKKGINTISSVLELGELKAEVFGFNVKSREGKYNSLGEYLPIRVENIGSIEQKWTLTVLENGKFSCLGEGLGGQSVGKTYNGDMDFPFEPKNPVTGIKYFRLEDLWGIRKLWLEGDKITFCTNDSSQSFWQTRYVGKHSILGKRGYRIAFSGQIEE